MAPTLNLYLPGPALNLCSPVLRFTVKVCYSYSYSVYLYKLSVYLYVQSNLYETTTLGTTQNWSSWTGGSLIEYLYKTTTNQIWFVLDRVLVFIPTVNFL